MKQFVDFVLQRFDLSHIQRVPGRIVVLDRVPYIAHPRSQLSNAKRVLGNLAELTGQLSTQINTTTVPLDIQIHTMVNQTMREQIQTIREASIVIANHGAGLTHLMWLEDNAYVVEMSCTINFFKELVKWKSEIYHFCHPAVQETISESYWKKNVVSVIERALKAV
jgi:capsular polysaccharide biosynthesis protein